MRRAALILLATFIAAATGRPQDSGSSLLDDFVVPDFPPLGFLIAYFPSELIGNGMEVKSYIRSDRFRRVRMQFGDLRAVDAVFIRALQLTRGNTALALLYSATASMDHRVVGIKVPLLRLFLPLSNESQEEFDRRVGNLPDRFYADHRSGDRDKLQHFFGSAFIAHVFESRRAAQRVGDFVEWGEDAFIVQGAYDERDMRANRQGREFGLSLIYSRTLPSDFLRIEYAGPPAAWQPPHHVCGAW